MIILCFILRSMAIDSYMFVNIFISLPQTLIVFYIFWGFLFLCFNVAGATDDATAVDDTTMFLFVTMYT